MPELKRIFSDLTEARIAPRREQVELRARDIRARASAQGALRSSGTVRLLRQEFEGELRERAELALGAFDEVMSRGVGDDLTFSLDECLHMIDGVIDAQAYELSTRLRRHTESIQSGNVQSPAFGNVIATIRQEASARVALTLLELKRKPTAGTAQIFNFHNSTVGTVQTGSNATANVSLGFAPGAIDQLREAMTLVRDNIHRATQLSEDTRAEVEAGAHEVVQELERAEPNRFKVASIASGIATLIQTIGSMQPAYGALKSALQLVGFLPPSP